MSDRTEPDELATLAALRSSAPPPSAATLDAARARLVERIDAPVPIAGPRSRRRWLPALAAAASVAALAAASVALTTHHSGGPQAAPSSYRTGSQLTAGATTTAPYLHITTHSWGLSEASLKERDIWYSIESVSEEWVPSDWSRTWYWQDRSITATRFLSPDDAKYVHLNNPELLQPGTDFSSGKDGTPDDDSVACPGKCDPAPGWDNLTPEFLTSLPTDPSVLRTSLYAAADRLATEAAKYYKSDDADSQAFDYIGDLLGLAYLPADLRSAAYQVATTIPGVSAVGDEKNLDGVHGVGLSRLDASGDARTDLMFTSPGGTYLGKRAVVVSPDWVANHGSTTAPPVPMTNVPVGTVIADDAVTITPANAPPPTPTPSTPTASR